MLDGDRILFGKEDPWTELSALTRNWLVQQEEPTKSEC